ncbi:hypothetical protein J6590_104888, partial [Homalodisca vitripennis]
RAVLYLRYIDASFMKAARLLVRHVARNAVSGNCQTWRLLTITRGSAHISSLYTLLNGTPDIPVVFRDGR